MTDAEYISRFSHELRNPLTLIYSSLQLLEKECPSVRESALWGQIQKDMRDVIQLLKDMSAPFSSYQMTPIDPVEFLTELSASFLPSMRMRGIDFTTDFSAELSGVRILADRQKLRQAITNLIVNAADAVSQHGESEITVPADATSMPDTIALTADASAAPGTIALTADASSAPDTIAPPTDASATPGRITLSAVLDGADVCIHVRDNGSGIPQEYLADLFDPFVTHKANGTGLGLGIARTIAEQHGGTITVDTCTDPAVSYTDFCLRLPQSRNASTKPAAIPPM